MALLAHKAGGLAGDAPVTLPERTLITPEGVRISVREMPTIADEGPAGVSPASLRPVASEVAAPASAVLDPVDAIDAGKVLANDRMGQFAANVPPEPGYFDVAVHGAPVEFLIKSDSFTG